MILVAFWHGLRASEVVQFSADQVQDAFLTIHRLKGSLKTVHPLVEDPEPLLNERQPLIDYVAKIPPNQKVFPVSRRTFYSIVSRHAAAAGLPKHLRHPHMLKHSIAMQTIHSAGIENVRQYLGHKSISSTGAYLKVSDSEASSAVLRAAKL